MTLTDRDQTTLQGLVLIIDACASGKPEAAKSIALNMIERLYLGTIESGHEATEIHQK